MTEYISREAAKAEFAKVFSDMENKTLATCLGNVANEILDKVSAVNVGDNEHPIDDSGLVHEYKYYSVYYLRVFGKDRYYVFENRDKHALVGTYDTLDECEDFIERMNPQPLHPLLRARVIIK